MSVKKTSNMALADFPFLGRFVDGAKCSTIQWNSTKTLFIIILLLGK